MEESKCPIQNVTENEEKLLLVKKKVSKRLTGMS